MFKTKFNFKTSLSSYLKCMVSEETNLFLARASLDALEGLVPLSVRGDKNIDLLPVVFNVAVAGLANLNGDVMDGKTAISIHKQFVNRPINLAHDRNAIIGHVVDAGFSEFGTDKPLTKEQVKDLDVFNIALAGVIYRVVNNDLAELIEDASDPTSPNYMKVHTSWELGFEGWKLVKGSKVLSEAEIVSDENFEEYNAYLKINKGSGFDPEGKPVYRLITIDAGYVLPLGAAKTLKPAGDVQGVYAVASEETQKQDKESIEKAIKEHEEKKQKQPIEETVAEEASTEAIVETTHEEPVFAEEIEREANIVSEEKEQKEKNISTFEKTNVKVTTQDMKIKSLEDIKANWDELQKQETAASIVDFMVSELKAEGEKFSSALAEKESYINISRAEMEKMSKEAKEVAAELEEVKQSLSSVRAAQAAKEQEETFNARMESLSSEYELDAEMSKIVASEINGLSDEEFDTWQKKFSVFAKYSKRPAMASVAQEQPEETERKIKEAFASVSQSTKAPENQGPESKKSQKEIFAEAFSDKNVTLA